MITIGPNVVINESELIEEFVRASGPGGQNVNKVSTAVQLRFDAAHSPGLPGPVRARLLKLAGSRATKEGIVLIKSQAARTQERNRELARESLIALILQATEKPKPRRPTRPTAGSQQRRLETKKQIGETKRLRRGGAGTEASLLPILRPPL